MNIKVPGKVLVYACRGHTRFFYEVAKRTFQGDIFPYTDWSGDLEGFKYANLMTDFYNFYKNGNITTQLSKTEIADIVCRCRVLRVLSYDMAESMVHAMYLTAEKVISTHRPDYFLSRSVDHYIIDIFCRVCEKYGVNSILLIAGSIDNTIIVTRYGEYNFVREPDEVEVDKALANLLDNSSHITFGRKSARYTFRQHFKAFTLFWLKNFIFKILAFLSQDPLNFRFLSSFTFSEEGYYRSFFNFHFPQFDESWENKMNEARSPVLYLPLNYVPECSTDYWLQDLRIVKDYEAFVIQLCEKLGLHFTLLIKEHWAILGKRKGSFYTRLKQVPGVILIPPETNNREILQKVSNVLLGVGTTGIEAAVRGKCIVTLGMPYYFVEGYYFPILSIDNLDNIPQILENFIPRELGKSEQRNLVRRMLETTIPGNLLPNDSLNSEHNLSIVSQGLKKYLEALLVKVK